ncbi:Nuclear pore complex protein nup88 [Sarracenia purpurea var. burkii]
MRYGFDTPETGGFERPTLTPTPSSKPKDDGEWIPLQNHPIFATSSTAGDGGTARSSTFRMPENLMAWDGASRLYFWDSDKRCLHRISVSLGEPDHTSVLAASNSKVLQADVQLTFVVNKISINRNGSAILLAGSDGLCVMYLYGHASVKDGTTICRTVSIGSQIYFNSNSIIHTLQISWHPYSDTHLGILSSDSVFRLFDLASSLGQPEQEYYLQPMEPGRCRNAASICPIDFSFGGEHLWDRFSVFVLFSDGSIYILCPVVPFGSVYKWDSVLEIYSDAQSYGLKSTNPRAVSNSNLAITWLEATFPELHHQDTGGNVPAVKAQPYALFDASVSMQGPLPEVCHSREEDSEVRVSECEGRAVSLLYNTISKDSILVTAWSGGQLQIDALADEIQPLWVVGSPPRLCVDSRDQILRVAMICESIPDDYSIAKLDHLPPDHTVWSGHPPPLLRVAVVDLALPRKKGSNSLISMFIDPLIPERIHTLHWGGIDSIVLHFLPFTSQTSDKDKSMRTPSVHPVLSTCQGESSSASPLLGFVALSDSFGYSWIAGLTSSWECIVLEMKTWDILLPVHVDIEKKTAGLEESEDIDTPTIISKELLNGPKAVLLPPSSSKLRSVIADSIEGRSALHQYFKLFHENYVEYAHKVYFELKHHGPHLKKVIEDQHGRLREAQQKLFKVEEEQGKLENRISRATQMHSSLEERVERLRNLPGVKKKPLSKAERDLKSELDRFTGVELDALNSSIEAVNARIKRYTHSLQRNLSNQRKQSAKKNYVQDDQISQLKSSMAKLSLLNSENTKKVKLLESTLANHESIR